MASSATLLFKPLSMADAPKTLTTLATLFGAPKTLHPLLSIPSKPSKTLHLSCSHSSPPWISLKKSLLSRNLVTLVASTSDWAQQEEEESRVDEEVGEEGEEGEFNWENQQTEDRVSWESGEEIGGSEGDDDGGVVGSGAEEDGGVGEGSGGGGFFEEPLNEDAKLFVGNLPYDVDSEKLAQLFDQAGVVEVAEVIYNRDTDQSRGFGFVTMSTVEEAEKAVETFNRFDFDGRLLTVNKAAPRGARPERSPRSFEPSCRIYVGNLPWQVDNARLEQVFSEHGKVVEARVVYDRESGRSRGFGFVTMASQTEVDDAIAALDGQSLDGRALRVNVAEERPRRGF